MSESGDENMSGLDAFGLKLEMDKGGIAEGGNNHGEMAVSAVVTGSRRYTAEAKVRQT